MVRRCIIASYHYVRDPQLTEYPEIKALHVEDFKQQLKNLSKHYTFIKLEDYVEFLNGKKDIPDNSVILSFDDGFKDHYKNVFPILRSNKISACFFPMTQPLVEFKVPPVHKTHFLLAKIGARRFADEYNRILMNEYPELIKDFIVDDKIKNHSNHRWDDALTANLKFSIARLDFKVKTIIIERIFRKYFNDEKSFCEQLYMTWEDMREMIDAGMTFGSHTIDHPMLAELSEEEQLNQLKASKEILEKHLNVKVTFFSYPYGSFNNTTISLLKKIGYECALTVDFGINSGKVEPYTICRMDANDLPKSDDEFICQVCGKLNKKENTFCSYCRYPINVKLLNDFDSNDINNCLNDLSDVIHKEKQFANPELQRLYDELFNFYWLRPETSAWRFVEAEILSDFKSNYLKFPVLDLGCGSGVFTAILFGARINPLYDDFGSVDLSKTDVYNNQKAVPKDFFITRPSKIGYGLDIKENAVNNATQLNIFEEVKVGDIKDKIPFQDKSMSSVFSNMIDDIKEEALERLFKEVHRVLKQDGYFVFTSPDKNYRNYLYYINKAKKCKERGDVLGENKNIEYDRGRSAWEPRLLSFWGPIFKNTSFELVKVVGYGDKQLTCFWDTGFRPFFKPLINMKNKLESNNLLYSSKRVIVEILKHYFYNICSNQIVKNGSFAIYVLKKV